MSHLQYYILHCPAQCCGAGAGAVAGAGQSRYFWSEPEPMKRREGKNVFYYSLAYFYIKRSRSQKRVSGARAGAGKKWTGSATLVLLTVQSTPYLKQNM